MKNLFLFASIVVASGVLFVNIYTSLVDVKSWGASIPDSIATARSYFKNVNPGDFFRMFSPVNQVLALIVLVIFRKTSVTVRIFLASALLLYVLGDVMTFGYFYPRNEILFRSGSLTDIELLKKTLQEWSSMNWIRSLLLLTGIVFSLLSLVRIMHGVPKNN